MDRVSGYIGAFLEYIRLDPLGERNRGTFCTLFEDQVAALKRPDFRGTFPTIFGVYSEKLSGIFEVYLIRIVVYLSPLTQFLSNEMITSASSEPSLLSLYYLYDLEIINVGYDV